MRLLHHSFFLPALVLVLANFTSLAFVEWKSLSRHLTKDHSLTRKSFLTTRIQLGPKSSSAEKQNFRRKNHRRNRTPKNDKGTMSKSKAIMIVYSLRSPYKINNWLKEISQKNQSKTNPFYGWNTRDQIEFIKVLKETKAYEGIMVFLDLGKQNVKVFTTATFAMALSKTHRGLGIQIFDKMEKSGIEATSLSAIALLGSIDGPSAVSEIMKRLEKSGVSMSTEAYNSAIFAIGRTPTGTKLDDKDWQFALNLLQKMRSQRIKPTSKTYHALLQILGRRGKVGIAMSLIQQWKTQNPVSVQGGDHVWASAINVCAQATDYIGAIKLIKDMQEMGCTPKLRHCSALLKALASAGQDELALASLQMMIGETVENGPAEGSENTVFHLPKIEPDLIALNTVMKACAKANNVNAVKLMFQRIKSDEFPLISPDLITYHCILKVCSSSDTAKDILKEVRYITTHVEFCSVFFLFYFETHVLY